MTNDDVEDVAQIFVKCFAELPINKAVGVTYEHLLVIGKEVARLSASSGYASPRHLPSTSLTRSTLIGFQLFVKIL